MKYLCAIILVTVLLIPPAFSVEFVTPQMQASVNKALNYLKRTQASDGSWGGRNPAVTALACMAFMANGDLPGRGKFGVNVERGINYLVKQQDSSGYLGGNGGQMYGHGFATLALVEAYGMVPKPELRKSIEQALKCIVKSQKADGGWRYDPSPQGEADLSITICQMMALRAANNSGFFINRNVIDRAIKYTKRSAQPDGGFSYTLNSGGSSFPRTGAGVTCLFGAGEYDCPEVKKGLEYLKKAMQAGREDGYFFYGHYYAAQAMHQAGGDYWVFWYPRIRDELIRKQKGDGSWQSEVSDDYGAAVGAIILLVPYEYLPILQR